MPVFINQKPVKSFIYPGGECHVSLNTSEISDTTEIMACLYDSNAVMELLLTVDAVRHINPHSVINLTVPYFPYARQDRVCNAGESLSVSVMANLLNGLNCQKITVYDPHSDVTPALINRCHTLSLAELLTKTNLFQQINEQRLLLVSPDAGAEKKINAVSERLLALGSDTGVIYARKERDSRTGNILSTFVEGNISGNNLIVLDDICDGGRTFIELAKALKSKGAGHIYLYVTHGIFSAGLYVLKKHFKHVYCYHTMLCSDEIDSSFLSVLGDIPLRSNKV